MRSPHAESGLRRCRPAASLTLERPATVGVDRQVDGIMTLSVQRPVAVGGECLLAASLTLDTKPLTRYPSFACIRCVGGRHSKSEVARSGVRSAVAT